MLHTATASFCLALGLLWLALPAQADEIFPDTNSGKSKIDIRAERLVPPVGQAPPIPQQPAIVPHTPLDLGLMPVPEKDSILSGLIPSITSITDTPANGSLGNPTLDDPVRPGSLQKSLGSPDTVDTKSAVPGHELVDRRDVVLDEESIGVLVVLGLVVLAWLGLVLLSPVLPGSRFRRGA
jgi:hypothetical protein